jgi:hypothetical protein
MPLSFPETGDSDAVVGQTPWSARVPLDPLFCNEISLIESQRADQGVGKWHWDDILPHIWPPC